MKSDTEFADRGGGWVDGGYLSRVGLETIGTSFTHESIP